MYDKKMTFYNPPAPQYFPPLSQSTLSLGRDGIHMLLGLKTQLSLIFRTLHSLISLSSSQFKRKRGFFD